MLVPDSVGRASARLRVGLGACGPTQAQAQWQPRCQSRWSPTRALAGAGCNGAILLVAGGPSGWGPASRKQHRALEPASDSESTVTGKLQVEARASLSAELRLPIKLHPAAQAARGMPRGRHGAGGQGHA
jgi:hypothetical protein